jgi:hypothetical protein
VGIYEPQPYRFALIGKKNWRGEKNLTQSPAAQFWRRAPHQYFCCRPTMRSKPPALYMCPGPWGVRTSLCPRFFVTARTVYGERPLYKRTACAENEELAAVTARTNGRSVEPPKIPGRQHTHTPHYTILNDNDKPLCRRPT